MATQVLIEVPWHAFDAEAQMPYYRSCDFCFYTTTDEISRPEWNPETNCRQFFRLVGDPSECVACEECVERLYEPIG